MNSQSPMDADPLLGAIDIVEAFTSLRHELKLQVRSGRELQQAIDQRLHQLESQLSEQVAWIKKVESTARFATGPDVSSSSTDDHDARQLAEAMAEIEEHLQRAVEMLEVPANPPQQNPAQNNPAQQNTEQDNCEVQAHINLILGEFDRTVSQAAWSETLFAGPLLQRLRGVIQDTQPLPSDDDPPVDPASERLEVTRRGLELLLDRVRRLMLACDLERHDVVGLPFDPESMRAIDVIANSDVPAAHVAEQLRPLYRWQGQVLKFADVRLAK